MKDCIMLNCAILVCSWMITKERQSTYWKYRVQQTEQFVQLDYADAGLDDCYPTDSSPVHQLVYSVNLQITIYKAQAM